MSMAISGVGSITKDGAVLRDVGSTQVLSFTVNNGRKVKGEWKNDYIKCNIWGERGRKLSEYLTPKTRVFVSGEFSTNKWGTNNDKMDVECNVNTIQLLGESEGGRAEAPQDRSGEVDDFGF